MTEQRTFIQYRAVAVDAAEDADAEHAFAYERGIACSSQRAAERDLRDMLGNSEPPYDDGWIETREVTEWRRI